MKTNYVLIDYENVQVKSLELLQGDHFRVRVFLGKNNSKLHRELVIAMHSLGDRAQYVELESSGSNALDFYIAYYLGLLVASDPTGTFHIISKDTGFDPLIQHLKSRKVMAVRSASIEEMPCFVLSTVAVDAGPTSPAPTTKPKAASNAKANPQNKKSNSAELEQRVEIALADLRSRKVNRPAKMKTLVNTIHTRIGKERPLADAEAVRDELVKRGCVLVNGLKVDYRLSEAG